MVEVLLVWIAIVALFCMGLVMVHSTDPINRWISIVYVVVQLGWLALVHCLTLPPTI